MSTTNLPIEFSGWTDSQKQSVLIALAQDIASKRGPFPFFVGGADDPSFLLLGLFNQPQEIIMDDNNSEHRELKRRAESKESEPLEPFLDEIMKSE
jgi:hypothetical protein